MQEELWEEKWLGNEEKTSEPRGNLHERVVDRDHKHLTSLLQRGVVDVTGHVGAGASRACGSKDYSSARGTKRQAAVYHGKHVCTVDLEAY